MFILYFYERNFTKKAQKLQEEINSQELFLVTLRLILTFESES